MVFFIKTHYSEAERKWFFRKNYIIDLISISIVADNGQEYFAANDDFHSRYITKRLEDEVLSNLPTREGRMWKSQQKIVSEVLEFLMYQSDGNVDKLVFEHPLDYAAFCSLMGTTNNPKWPIWLPKYYMDIKQSIREYLDDQPDERFETDPDFGSILLKYDDTFRLEQKLEMLLSHRCYPEQSKTYTALQYAHNMRKMYAFFKQLKSYNPKTETEDADS